MKLHIKENSWLAKLAAKKLRTDNVAMVLGSTIHLYNTTCKDFLNNQRWLRHELVHVAQFKRYGFVNFLLRYLWESIKNGYHNNKFEVEAQAGEQQEIAYTNLQIKGFL